ncbi:MAG TPA: flavodoxin family protein [Methanoregulaceae archaeon]|nr:flavodoxin family protein [Methanoregulaceae archaeon]HOV67756.1 flavodoxin family protein [Methanoregulaceae archaeon]HQJ87765.1 flavodoxin family protein [Methanoregulaceae archaeon]
MPITVLGFAGSPRRHGNSETLLDWVLAAMASEPDVEVEKVVVVDAGIGPCRGCNACERTGACVQQDGMTPLYDRILEADCVVLAAPIYCLGLPAQAKALIDRAQVYRSRRYVLGWPVIPEERRGKRIGLFLSTAGQAWDHVFDAAIPSVKCFFHVAGFRERDLRYLLVRSVDESGAIRRHPTASEEARALGHEVATTLRERIGA